MSIQIYRMKRMNFASSFLPRCKVPEVTNSNIIINAVLRTLVNNYVHSDINVCSFRLFDYNKKIRIKTSSPYSVNPVILALPWK